MTVQDIRNFIEKRKLDNKEHKLMMDTNKMDVQATCYESRVLECETILQFIDGIRG